MSARQKYEKTKAGKEESKEINTCKQISIKEFSKLCVVYRTFTCPSRLMIHAFSML